MALINPPVNDPVSRAVVDNIMGTLPTKKPLVRCDECELSFTSQTVLDAHLQGARHAKQMRSKVILATLEETRVAFIRDQEANGLKCNVCNVCLNSIQQLQTHLNGNRHKKKIIKGGWNETEATESKTPDPPPAKNDPEPSPVKGTLLSCNVCNKFFNSEAQYDVHITSKKHTMKANGNAAKNKKKRFFPYRRNSKPGHSDPKFQSLSDNFIPGGYVNRA